MKIKTGLALSFLAIFLSCSNKVRVQPSSKNNLVVMAYNIHHCNPPSKPDFIDVDAVANVIKAENPDLVALQEVDVNTPRSGKAFNQAQQLAERTGLKYYFAKAIDYQGGEYGVAILSKFDIQEAKVYKLPMAPGTTREQRVLATGKITLPNGAVIRFGTTHLDATSDPTDRELQIKEINRIASTETLPFVVAGDFNAATESSIVSQLDQKFQRTCTTCEFTIPSVNPKKTIDFIAYAPAPKFKTTMHKVIQAPYPSDHLPVVAHLEVQK